ncbi:MAG: RNA methyltransferase [Bacteroidota bacterium]
MHQVDGLKATYSNELIEFLKKFITEERYKKFQTNIIQRTRFITIALEDIFQPHNASAVLRTCDCFGIQDVHIIENRNKYQVNPDVALGSSKWLNLIHHNLAEDNTISCLKKLRQLGYRLVATSPHQDGFTPETLPLDQKTALIFGTELAGLSPMALEMADDFIKIPMVGFTESLNISVSAAIFIQSLTSRLRTSSVPWQLSNEEQSEIMVDWLKNSIKRSDGLVNDFFQKREGPISK